MRKRAEIKAPESLWAPSVRKWARAIVVTMGEEVGGSYATAAMIGELLGGAKRAH